MPSRSTKPRTHLGRTMTALLANPVDALEPLLTLPRSGDEAEPFPFANLHHLFTDGGRDAARVFAHLAAKTSTPDDAPIGVWVRRGCCDAITDVDECLANDTGYADSDNVENAEDVIAHQIVAASLPQFLSLVVTIGRADLCRHRPPKLRRPGAAKAAARLLAIPGVRKLADPYAVIAKAPRLKLRPARERARSSADWLAKIPTLLRKGQPDAADKLWALHGYTSLRDVLPLAFDPSTSNRALATKLVAYAGPFEIKRTAQYIKELWPPGDTAGYLENVQGTLAAADFSGNTKFGPASLVLFAEVGLRLSTDREMLAAIETAMRTLATSSMPEASTARDRVAQLVAAARRR